jgi:hypothetical protein
MIALSSQQFDLLAHIILKPNPNSGSITFQRRVTRTATLDGNSALSDMGYSASDNTLNIEISNITQAEINVLENMVKIYPTIIYYDKTGVYSGVIETINTAQIPIRLTYLVGEQLA